jgi:dTDP-4-amino-4,6-dideoxygalactose transaminase
MLTTDDDEIAAFARSYQHRGRDLGASGEQYAMPGRNVRMTEMSALLGRVQLSHLDEYLENRRRVASIYISELSSQPGLILIHPDQIDNSSFWKFPIVLDGGLDRTIIAQEMSDVGIAVDWAYAPAVHLQPVFQRLYGTSEGLLPITEEVMTRHLCLPCHPRISDKEAIFVAKELRRIVSEKLKDDATQ